MTLLLILSFYSIFLLPQNGEVQGIYFSKKTYEPRPLLKFDNKKDLLPNPIDAENPHRIETYWEFWEMAFKNGQ